MKNKNKLGYIGTLCLVIGNIIGVGIFTTTGYVAQFVESPLIIMSAWVLGGIYALSGAFVYSTLAKNYPLSGGDYQYLSHELHPLLGYLFGWSALMITYTGSIAALSIGSAHYFNSVFNIDTLASSGINLHLFGGQIGFTDEKVIAILIVIIFSWINIRGIKISGFYQTILTILIVLFLIGFTITGLLSSKIQPSLLTKGKAVFEIGNYLTAFIAVIFTYIGWTSAVYIAEEITEPKKILSSVLILGVSIVSILYLFINMLYLLTLPVADISNVINIASVVAINLWGKKTAIFVSLFIFIAVLSTVNSTILSGARIYMAMSREGHFLGKLSAIHKKYDTPYKAIFIQAAWSIVLIVSGSFNQLLSYIVFVIMIFSSLAGFISIRILLRNKVRNYFKTIICIFYCGLCLVISVNTMIYQFYESIIGIILIIISFVFYLFESRLKKV